MTNQFKTPEEARIDANVHLQAVPNEGPALWSARETYEETVGRRLSRAQRQRARREQDEAKTRPNNNRGRVLGVTAGALMLPLTIAGAVVANRTVEKATGFDRAVAETEVADNVPHREYVIQAGDTAWNVANLAFPEDAGIDHASEAFGHRKFILSQLPDGIPNPGDVIRLSADANIGELKPAKDISSDEQAKELVDKYTSNPE